LYKTARTLVNPTSTPLVPIISARRCIGFLLRRGREGVEAYDANERSLGIFLDPIEAAAAVESAALVGPGHGGDHA
jgi:hypothetical protein